MDGLYIELKEILEHYLKDIKHEIKPAIPNTGPFFLFLTVKPTLVGFAEFNGQPKENFSKAFQKFQELYSVNSSEWADFELTLILCKTKDSKATDEFCNKIEMDPYFCRKFVIDVDNIDKELQRLPIIPLHPENIIGLKRPSTAQTFLIKHSLSPKLAEYLAVPHVRGIGRIIEECLQGLLGEHTWHKAKDIKQLEFPRKAKTHIIRLKELEISNFRAYSKTRKFNLNADLVVLYGPNGFGKTSFFDAIDFICTGSVTRFDDRFGRKTNRLIKVLKHLDSTIDNSYIKAKILLDDKEVVLKRYVKSRTNTYIKNNTKNRKEVLRLLTGISKEWEGCRIDNFISLFRATHLFAQEYQTITPEKFKKESKLTQELVSRMLAFQDYVEAINKSKRVFEELKKQVIAKKVKCSFFKDSLKSKEKDAKEFSRLVKILEKPKAILSFGKKLENKIRTEINSQLKSPRKYTQKMLHGWRSLIMRKISYTSHELELINKLENDFPKFLIMKSQLKGKLIKLKQKEKLFDKLSEDYSTKINSAKELNRKLKRMHHDEKNFSLKRENLNWLLGARGEYKKLKVKLENKEKTYKKVQEILLDLIPKVKRLRFIYKGKEKTSDKLKFEIKSLKHILNDLDNFKKKGDDWEKAINLQEELRENLKKIRKRREATKNKLTMKKEDLSNVIINRDILTKNLEDLQRSQSELKILLVNIEEYISDNICPVCGAQYKSREELIKKLKMQQGFQPDEIRDISTKLSRTKTNVNSLKKQINDLESKLKRMQQSIDEIKRDSIETKKEIKAYEEEATSIDIQKFSFNLIDIIDSKMKEVSEQIRLKQQRLDKQKSESNKLKTELSKLIKQQESLEQDIQTTESIQNQLQSMIEKIRNDSSTRMVSLNLQNETINNKLLKINTITEELPKQIEITESESSRLKKETNRIARELNTLKREINELESDTNNSERFIEEIQTLTKKLNLKLGTDLGKIRKFKKDTKQKISNLDSLLNEITDFEIALDTAQKSATLGKIQQDIKEIKQQVQSLEEEKNHLNNWLSYFDIIREKLEYIQNDMLEEYTNKYGPLTSIIQKRLRSVYGFGDISLHPEKGEIAVRVKRKAKINISPSDYFSESQIQILMLSIFLSAALTQTWSSFAPVLLDDAVEHFDDLNAYSFLDLIRDLVINPKRKRQFIISTCDNRLFHLMRQKFSKMDGNVLFYIFDSIGENGPQISNL